MVNEQLKETENDMATLTVWKFDGSDGARGALLQLERMQKEELIQIVDAAIVTWPAGRKKPKTEQLRSTTAGGALFFVPLLGMAVGAAMGALSGSLTDVGIDDGFIKRVRDEVTPGTSALFVMSVNAVADRVIGEFRETGAHLVSTNLSSEQEARLRAAFADEDEVTEGRAVGNATGM
jgi:uncharacterized membrane protein